MVNPEFKPGKNLDQLAKEFEEYGYLEADMSTEELKEFLEDMSYEMDEEDWDLPPVESNVSIGSCGGVKYFSDGDEIVIAYNGDPCPDFDTKSYARDVMEWLLKHEIPFEFE